MAESSSGSSSESSSNRFRRLLASQEEPDNNPPWFPKEEPSAESAAPAQPAPEPGVTQSWFAQEGSDLGALLHGNEAPEPASPETPAAVDLGGVDAPPALPAPPVESPPLEFPSVEQTPAPRRSRTPPPPPLGTTPQNAPPALGTQAMPLPRRVDEIDVDATRVSPSAYTPPRKPTVSGAAPRPDLPPLRRPPASKPSGDQPAAPLQPATPSARPPIPPAPRQEAPSPSRFAEPPKRQPPSAQVDWRSGLGCLLRMLLIGLFGLIVLGVALSSFIIYQYYSISSTLPSVEDMRQRASQFETTRILDRNGQLLYEILDPSAGRRTYVPLDKISPYLIAATIATEDKNYYAHPGFDWLAIVRAFWQNAQSGGETVSGASTITQQLVRALFMTAEERGERTYMRKVREALLAAEVTRQYSKEEILELYLNEIYYGNFAYGIEAAAETYFGVSAEKLTLAQAAFLAGLPQAPSVYDVFTNRDAALARQQQVLVLMFEMSKEAGCIYISNQPQPVCITDQEAIAAYLDIQSYVFQRNDVQMRHPHWVTYVVEQLEAQYDPQTIYRSGFTVYTTLDPGLQASAEQIVKDQVNALADRHVTDGALVALRPSTGEILAMVGSADFYNDAIQGQVNMATSPTRQPGSAIKPMTYLAAFEKGWTPATLIWDVPSEFPPSGIPNDPSPPYQPVNYDGRFHGPVTVRTALANSYNVPAVKALQFVGVYDDPSIAGEDGLIAMARRLGITSLNQPFPNYGLALTLGGGEVSLLELTGAYSILANGGRKLPLVSITKIVDHNGQTVYEYAPPAGEQVVRAEHAYLISSILSDNDARAPMFGTNSVLALPFVAAAKTGTTNDFRDNWTVGYTPDLAVGVWVGNADYTPMQGTTGLSGAAPIWAQFMQTGIQQITGGQATPFFRPAGIMDRIICAVSGAEPSQWCPSQRSEMFAGDQPPLPKEQDLWVKILFDTWTNLRASPACGNFTSEQLAINVTDPWGKKWITDDANGRAWAEQMGFDDDPLRFTPERECRADDSRPILTIVAPTEGQTVIANPLDIFGRVDATSDFASFSMDYSPGPEPVAWERLMDSTLPMAQADKIYPWDVSKLPAGPVTLRINVRSTSGTFAELLIHLNLQVPTPTPTPTLTPTPSPTPSLTPTTTSTLLPSQTPTLAPTATLSATPAPVTAPPTLPPPPPATETPTLVPSETPTTTPTVTPGGP